MTSKATEKIIDALTQLLEGYSELQEMVEKDFGARIDTDDEEEEATLSREIDAALVIEIRAALETVMESDDVGAEELASVISIFSDALEEIDPDVFASEDEEEEEDDEDDDDDEDLDDDDLDLDDLDEDDDDDDEK